MQRSMDPSGRFMKSACNVSIGYLHQILLIHDPKMVKGWHSQGQSLQDSYLRVSTAEVGWGLLS